VRSEPVVVRGPSSLQLATRLLQQMRLDRPAGGIWEAADLQWWSRYEHAADGHGQLFWLDAGGDPLAAVIGSDFGRSLQCDVLVRPDDPQFERRVWTTALSRADDVGEPAAEFTVRADNRVGIAVLTAAGLRPVAGESIVASWLDPARRPPVPALSPGYRLLSRARDPDRPYWLIPRNGPHVEGRLRRCSLYEPELDLMVEAPDGSAAGYGLFWADPVTGVGLVEPMRTEAAHERRGIASHVLAAGLDLLAARGCRRLKVSNDIGLYLRAGFCRDDSMTAGIYAR
jgi:GNAT superfamily N-acetyltransferase